MPSQVGAQQMSNAYQQPYPQAPAQADQMGAQQMNDAYLYYSRSSDKDRLLNEENKKYSFLLRNVSLTIAISFIGYVLKST